MRPTAVRAVTHVAIPVVAVVALVSAHSLGPTPAGPLPPRQAAAASFLDMDLLDREHGGVLDLMQAAAEPRPVDPTPAVVPAVAPPPPPPAPTSVPVSAMASGGIPAASLAAYRRAAESLAVADPTCHLEWTLVAAIGRVESGHGRSGISVVLANGRSEPPIIGNQLNGDGPFARILDTDGGTMDQDLEFDRAVGPMQFLPGTWRSSGRDGDGDGVKDVHDIDDAALAAGVYLCAGSTDLADPSQLRGAVWRYNHSEEYVDTVLGIMAVYAAVPPATLPNAAAAPPVPVQPLAEVPVEPASPDAPIVPAEPSPTPSPTAAPTPSPTPTESPTPNPSPSPTESPSPSESPTPSPTDSGSPSPSP